MDGKIVVGLYEHKATRVTVCQENELAPFPTVGCLSLRISTAIDQDCDGHIKQFASTPSTKDRKTDTEVNSIYTNPLYEIREAFSLRMPNIFL